MLSCILISQSCILISQVQHILQNTTTGMLYQHCNAFWYYRHCLFMTSHLSDDSLVRVEWTTILFLNKWTGNLHGSMAYREK